MELNANEIFSDRIVKLVRLSAPTLPGNFSHSQNLLQGGWLDSLAVVELGARIEVEFNCTVASDFYTIRSLESIETICAYVERKIIEAGKHESIPTSI